MRVERVPALLVALFLVVVSVAGCSPEASRVRGGGPGADVGNHSPNLPAPSTPPAPG
ncbi:MAG: hypothetical protein JO352_09240 [Chloroflexi bacterium]|nr:hypothetical protein [Chloroflexota bacterium]MBV9601628.1 hypothetical protein [Chloroflexota bacterium]